MYKPKVTSEDVRAYRDNTGCGIREAADVLTRKQVREDFSYALMCRRMDIECDIDIFDVIEYALFEMQGFVK